MAISKNFFIALLSNTFTSPNPSLSLPQRPKQLQHRLRVPSAVGEQIGAQFGGAVGGCARISQLLVRQRRE